MDKKTKLFREKNMESIDSPESLNDYLKVTSPGVWLVLGGIVFFLIGVCIWGVFGHIDSVMTAAVIAQEGETVCLVPEDALAGVLREPYVMIEGTEYELTPSALKPEIVSEDMDVYVILAGDLTLGQVVYSIPLNTALPEGIYSGTVVTEKLTPISLLMN